MKQTLTFCLLVVMSACLALSSLGCAGGEAPKTETVQTAIQQPTGGVGQDDPFDKRLLEIASSYQNYKQVFDNAGFAALDCRAVTVDTKADPRLSASRDARSHGRKLYWLYVKEIPHRSVVPGEYTVAGKPNAVGQVVVKEAWLAEKVDEGKDNDDRTRKYFVKEGDEFHSYRLGSKAALFVMYKLDPQTPGTDEGWIYGTLTADGQKVTSAGRVASCMGCHKAAPHDRLFGLAKD